MAVFAEAAGMSVSRAVDASAGDPTSIPIQPR
jgi:hypothetical protein